MQNKFRYQQAKRVTLIGGLCNIFLSVLKIFIGFIGHSQALIADGIHSASDLLTDALVLFASRAGSQAPDEKHPYGHGRYETISTVLVSMMLIMVSVGIIVDAVYKSFLHPSFIEPSVWTLVIVLVSIIINELLFHYTLRIGKRIYSTILNANAWHHRSDSFSSLIVLIGISGGMLGIHYMDGVAAIVVALIIIKMGIKMAWSSFQELTDASVDAELVRKFFNTINKMPGIKSVHQLRTRLLGGAVFIDVHVQVDSRLSVSEGHFLGEQVQKNLISDFSEIADVIVHVDSEDDELVMLSVLLPDRAEVKGELEKCWQSLSSSIKIQKLNLHYLGGKIEVDVFLPLSVLQKMDDEKTLLKQYRKLAEQISYVRRIDLYFS